MSSFPDLALLQGFIEGVALSCIAWGIAWRLLR